MAEDGDNPASRRWFLRSIGISAALPTLGSGMALGRDRHAQQFQANRQVGQRPTERTQAASPAVAGDWTQQAKLDPNDGDTVDWFGFSAALSNESTALIGATVDEDPNGSKAGSAYVFESPGDSWRQQAKLAPDDGDSFDRFGASVAVSDDGSTAVIGAFHDEDPNGDSAGSAYVFESSGDSWSQQGKLAADDGDSTDSFGVSVAVSSDGSTAIIGAVTDEDPNGSSAGAAYVFESSGDSWSQQSKLTPQDGDSTDAFGYSVAMSSDGSTAIIGAYWDEDPNGSRAGSAYVFESPGNSWRQQAKLTPQDGDSTDSFGVSVAVSSDGSTALIGAYVDEDPNGSGAGSAYVFESSGDSWRQQSKLTPQDGDDEDRFGWSVALDGETAVIGALFDEDPNGSKAGSAYVFESSGDSWRQQTKLTPQDGDSSDRFGASVAVSNDGSTALIGAEHDEDPNGSTAGSAYVFSGSGQQRATFAVTIDSTNAPVTAGDQFDVTATITNTGDQSGTKTVTLSVGGTQRATIIPTLDSGESQTVTLSWQTADGDSGTYTAEVATPTNSDTTSVTVSQGGSSPVDQYDQSGDGSIDIGELGTAAADFAKGTLSINALGQVAAAFAQS